MRHPPPERERADPTANPAQVLCRGCRATLKKHAPPIKRPDGCGGIATPQYGPHSSATSPTGDTERHKLPHPTVNLKCEAGRCRTCSLEAQGGTHLQGADVRRPAQPRSLDMGHTVHPLPRCSLARRPFKEQALPEPLQWPPTAATLFIRASQNLKRTGTVNA